MKHNICPESKGGCGETLGKIARNLLNHGHIAQCPHCKSIMTTDEKTGKIIIINKTSHQN